MTRSVLAFMLALLASFAISISALATYMPQLGRFMQADPNASGMQLVERVNHGRSVLPSVAEFDLESAMLDGPNLYAYARGNPFLRSDAMGLQSDDDDREGDGIGIGDIVPFIPTSAAVDAVAFVAKVSIVAVGTVRGGLEGLTGAYAANLELDIDWAMDWSQGDDNHSRLSNEWIAESFAEGLGNGYEQASEFVGGDPLDFGLGNPLLGGLSKGVRSVTKSGQQLMGQVHHAVSAKINRALEKNPGTKGRINRNDKKWLTRAATQADHISYQTWHRNYDDNAVKWIERNNPDPQRFYHYMKAVYRRPAMAKRFPLGIGE